MMMSLDMFVFEIGTLPYQQLAQSWGWRHASSERFGARPALQYLGPGEETISLTGALYPGQIGDWSSLARIREMADTGEAYTLLSGLHEVLGQFIIRQLTLTSEYFMLDGVPQKADFQLQLDRAA